MIVSVKKWLIFQPWSCMLVRGYSVQLKWVHLWLLVFVVSVSVCGFKWLPFQNIHWSSPFHANMTACTREYANFFSCHLRLIAHTPAMLTLLRIQSHLHPALDKTVWSCFALLWLALSFSLWLPSVCLTSLCRFIVNQSHLLTALAKRPLALGMQLLVLAVPLWLEWKGPEQTRVKRWGACDEVHMDKKGNRTTCNYNYNYIHKCTKYNHHRWKTMDNRSVGCTYSPVFAKYFHIYTSKYFFVQCNT